MQYNDNQDPSQKGSRISKILEMYVEGMYSFDKQLFDESFWNHYGVTAINGIDRKTQSHNQTGKSKVTTMVYVLITGEDPYADVRLDDIINYNLNKGFYGHLKYVDFKGRVCKIQRFRGYKPCEGGPEILTAEWIPQYRKVSGVTFQVGDKLLTKEADGEQTVEDAIRKSFGYSKQLLKMAMMTPQKENPASILLKNKKGDKEKKELFDELTGAQFCKHAYKMVQEDHSNTEKAIELTKNQIEVVYGQINAYKKDLDGLTESSQQFEKKREDEANRLADEKWHLDKSIGSLKGSLVDESEINSIREAIESGKNKIVEHKTELSGIQVNQELEVKYEVSRSNALVAQKNLEQAKANALKTLQLLSEDESKTEINELKLSISSGNGIERALSALKSASDKIAGLTQANLKATQENLSKLNLEVESLNKEDLSLIEESSYRESLSESQEKVLKLKNELAHSGVLNQNLVSTLNEAEGLLRDIETRISTEKSSLQSLESLLLSSQSDAQEFEALSAKIEGSNKPSETKEVLKANKSKFEKVLSEIQTNIAVLEGKISSEKERLSRMSDDRCPTCSQALTGEHVEHSKKEKEKIQANIDQINKQIEDQRARIPKGEIAIQAVESQLSLLEVFERKESLEKSLQSRVSVELQIVEKKAKVDALDVERSSAAQAVALAKSSVEAEKTAIESRQCALKNEIKASEEVQKSMRDDLEAVVRKNSEKNAKLKDLNQKNMLIAQMNEQIRTLSMRRAPYELLSDNGFEEKIETLLASLEALKAALAEELQAKSSLESDQKLVSEKRSKVELLIKSKQSELQLLEEKLAKALDCLSKSEETKALIAEKESKLVEIRTTLESIKAQVNPYLEMIESKNHLLVKAEDDVSNRKSTITEYGQKLRLLDEIKVCFSPTGLRSYLADPVIDKLNQYVNEYLKDLFFGEVSATWSPEKLDSNGNQTNEIQVEIIANQGSSKPGLASGAEEDYVSFAANVAVARIAEEQMGIKAPFKSYDEPFRQIDSAGQGRCLAFLNNLSRKSQQPIFLISHDENIKLFVTKMVLIEKVNHISRMAKQDHSVEMTVVDDSHGPSVKEAISEMFSSPKKRQSKKKSTVA